MAILEALWRDTVVSRLLGRDAARHLEGHAGKAFRIESGPFAAVLAISEGGAVFPVHPAVDADATLRVPLERVKGSRAREENPVIAEGDSELLKSLGKVADEAELSPEAVVEWVAGEDAGSAAAMLRSKGGQWGADACERLSGTFARWLREDGGVLASPDSFREHKADVGEFAERVDAAADRLEAAGGGAG